MISKEFEFTGLLQMDLVLKIEKLVSLKKALMGGVLYDGREEEWPLMISGRGESIISRNRRSWDANGYFGGLFRKAKLPGN